MTRNVQQFNARYMNCQPGNGEWTW